MPTYRPRECEEIEIESDEDDDEMQGVGVRVPPQSVSRRGSTTIKDFENMVDEEEDEEDEDVD